MSLKINKIWFALSLLVLVFFNSCSKMKRLAINDAETVLKNEIRIKYEAKARPQYIFVENANIKIEGKETNRAKINFYLERDRKLFLSIKVLGFEMIRFQLSEDSVKYINRLNREYYFSEVENVKKEVGELLNYTNLENLVLTGFVSTGGLSFDNFFNNSIISGDSLRFSDDLGPGQSVLCNYSLGTLQLFDLEYLDYVKQINSKMVFDRSDFGLKSIEGFFVMKGDRTKFSIDIDEIKFEKFSKTDFRLGRNYDEMESLL